jgi:hypothetical protein
VERARILDHLPQALLHIQESERRIARQREIAAKLEIGNGVDLVTCLNSFGREVGEPGGAELLL